ncbi:hypothetical protein [Hymenobacter radiodurans]|uniref:hypothetical protein n=1 Tax=Hymenobacter radiodurans TaxID=2496028 RepID=UPI0010591F24|nr:hypothetical protein [Hymenobacter radiodurans]
MSVNSHSLKDEQGDHYHITTLPDYELVTPHDYLLEVIVNAKYRLMQIIAQGQNIAGPRELLLQIMLKRAIAEWKLEYAEMLVKVLPVNLMSLLDTKRKNEQIHLTKGMELTNDELTAFIAQVGHFHGFLYSQYKSERIPNGTDLNSLPVFTHLNDDGSITKIGNSTLSDGQLKNVINQRKVLLGKFVEKGADWHCFVYTYDSINGKEKGDWGSHIHYISSMWGVPKADVVAGIKNGRYVSSGLPHIKIHSDNKDIPTKQ